MPDQPEHSADILASHVGVGDVAQGVLGIHDKHHKYEPTARNPFSHSNHAIHLPWADHPAEEDTLPGQIHRLKAPRLIFP